MSADTSDTSETMRHLDRRIEETRQRASEALAV